MPVRPRIRVRVREQVLYDKLWRLYDALVQREEYEPEAAFIIDTVRRHKTAPGNKLLDVGCGFGNLHLYLKSAFRITGVDASPTMLRVARKRNPDVTYRRGDVQSLRLRERYDVVTALDMLEYCLDYPSLERALANLARHLRPGGVLIFWMDVVKENFRQDRADVLAPPGEAPGFALFEYSYDPDPTDTVFQFVMLWVLREGRGLRVEVDDHTMGLFELKRVQDILARLGLAVSLFELDFSGEPFTELGPIFVCQRPAS
ncbi:MAG: class I SAM-dependent methyltransferase [Chloroflexi bacterium]|nr:class I SAM-dependent methyltransferase [Chloroflexota bacterium]